MITAENINKVEPVLKYLTTYLPFFLGLLIAMVTLLIVFFTALFKIVVILIVSLAAYLTSYKTISQLHYKKVLQITVHASTLPLTLDYLIPLSF